jgi:hypothetical protein
MAKETSNQGWIDAQAYEADPSNVEVPDSSHQEYEQGVKSYELAGNRALGAGTLTVDSANGRVGVNTATPNEELQINATDTGGGIQLTNTTTGSTTSDGLKIQLSGNDALVRNLANGIMSFSTNGTEAARIDSSQNLLVGKTTTDQQVEGAILAPTLLTMTSASSRVLRLIRNSTDGELVQFYHQAAQDGNIGTDNGKINMGQGAGTCFTIDSSQNFLVGKTTTSSAVEGIVLEGAGSGTFTRSSQVPLRTNRLGSDGAVMDIRNDDVTVGTISVSGSTTAYNTSSDYRLKEDIQPIVSATDRLLQLKPCNFAWKADGTRVDGFIAHELAEVIPEAVTGEKDAMKTVVIQEAVEAVEATYWTEEDELPEGVSVGDIKTEAVAAVEEVTEEQPDYQGIDQSKIVPLLVATIQELEARIKALESA